jgi:hypothetical protein
MARIRKNAFTVLLATKQGISTAFNSKKNEAASVYCADSMPAKASSVSQNRSQRIQPSL